MRRSLLCTLTCFAIACSGQPQRTATPKEGSVADAAKLEAALSEARRLLAQRRRLLSRRDSH